MLISPPRVFSSCRPLGSFGSVKDFILTCIKMWYAGGLEAAPEESVCLLCKGGSGEVRLSTLPEGGSFRG